MVKDMLYDAWVAVLWWFDEDAYFMESERIKSIQRKHVFLELLQFYHQRYTSRHIPDSMRDVHHFWEKYGTAGPWSALANSMRAKYGPHIKTTCTVHMSQQQIWATSGKDCQWRHDDHLWFKQESTGLRGHTSSGWKWFGLCDIMFVIWSKNNVGLKWWF